MITWSEEKEANFQCPYNHIIGKTPFGRFLITWEGCKKRSIPTVDKTPWGNWSGPFNDIKGAKEACEKEYKKRLKEAIDGTI